MVARVSVKTTGGARLNRALGSMRANAQKLRATSITVGFHERHIASIAARLELGAGPVPPRPAFELSIPRVKAAVRKEVAEGAIGRLGELTDEGARRIASAGEEALKEGYREFSYSGAPPLSARQKRRKRGTKGAGRLLVGTEGEKLIERIEGRVSKR